MRIMNVGNANSKQQNFGMNLDFTPVAKEMIGAENCERLSTKAKQLVHQATLKVGVLSWKRREILLEAPKYDVHRVVISDKPTGESTFGYLYSTMYGQLDFAIRKISRF